MLKKLNLDEFYTEDNKMFDKGAGLGGVGLITPNQSINVINYPVEENGEMIEGLGTHVGTYMMVLNEIFNLGIPNGKKGYPDQYEVKKIIPYCEMNFVHIQYVVQKAIDFVTVSIPMYITPYQFEELKKFNEVIKNYDITIESIILNYNPLKTSYEENDQVYFSSYDAIENSLKYLKDNNRVMDYELPFGEEKIISKNKMI